MEETFRSLERHLKGIDRMATRRGGFFNRETMRDFDRTMRQGGRHLRTMRDEHRRINQEVQRQKKLHDSLIKNDPNSVFAKDVHTRGVELEKQAQAKQQQIQQAEATMQQAQARRSQLVNQSRWERVKAAPGRFARNEWDAMRGTVVPRSVFTWALEKYKAGIGILIEQQRARTESEATTTGRRAKWGGLEGAAARMGYRPQEAHQVYRQTAMATGQAGTRGAVSNLAMMRAYGVDAGALTGFQGAATSAGDVSAVEQINQALVMSLKRSPFPRAFMTKFLQESTRVLGQMSEGRETVKGSEAAGLLATFSRVMGGVYMQSPSRSAGLLGRLGSTISQPGGGEAGQAFMLRAMGMGQDTDYIGALMRGEQGGTGQNLARMTRQIKSEYGGMSRRQQALALNRLSGGRVKIFEAFRTLGMTDEQLDALGTSEQSAGGKADVAGEGRHMSGRLGAQKRQIQRESLLANWAGANQKIADAVFTGEKAIMDATTKMAAALNDLVETIRGADNRIKNIGNAIRGGEVPGVSRSSVVKKEIKEIRAGRRSASDFTPTYGAK